MIGKTLAHYEILESIGSGGMGEVYRARDAKLHREVAIKVLAGKLAPAPERLARFEREAHLLASLNHPNIATIHGLEKDRGIDFLVLELVEGETLAERIARGPIPLDEALRLFEQIAHGLEAAHEKGIIHRDLKPPNLKITPDGHVKILDFGLGKVFETPEAGQVDLSQSPTLTRGGTRAGVILGTAAYMSPEQARSEAVDKRTDIWAFGCCLYEALTGKPAFSGKSVVDILASVVRVEPDWEPLPADTPFLVRRVLERSLEKDARRRLHDIADVRMDLEDSTTATPAVDTARSSKRSGLKYAALSGILLLGISVLVASLVYEPSPDLTVTRFDIETDPLNVTTLPLAFSPDGTMLAYSAPQDPDRARLHLRHMDQDRAIPIPDTEGARVPVFSPDGEWIAYQDRSSDKLQKISVRGGAPVTLCDYPSIGTFGTDWETQDAIFFAEHDGLFRVPSNGGERQLLEVTEAESDRVLVFPRRPDVLPGGGAVLLTVGDFPQGNATAIHDVETGKRWILLEDAVSARYVPTGHLVFLRDDTLHAVGFDLASLAIEGDPVPVLEDININLYNGSTHYALSDSGSLAYVPSQWDGFRRSLVLVDREGKVETIRSIPRRIAEPHFLPDGERIALTIIEGTRPGIWLTERSRETLTPLAPDEWGSGAVWSDDAERFAFTGMTSMGRTVIVRSLFGNESEKLGNGYGQVWSRDGSVLAYQRSEKGGVYNIWTAFLEGDRAPTPFLDTPFQERTPAFSPDGRWLAYESTESGRAQIYVQSLDKVGGKHQVSTRGGWEPLWSPDGTEIFYRSSDGVMAVDVETEPGFEVSSPQVLFPDDFLDNDVLPVLRNYDIAPDGKHFLMIRGEERPPPHTVIKIVLNWSEELSRLVPVDN